MRDVVVIGGGLSGLTAAYELERHGITPTLVEVQPRLGGSIVTTRQDGFTIDGGPFAFAPQEDRSFLAGLGLDDAQYPLKSGGVAFKTGAQTLVDALAAWLTGPPLLRMGVSSVGRVGTRYTICMENGLVYDARAIVVAVAARYAERMFYGFLPEVSRRLLDYRYDRVLRVSLGYRTDDLPQSLATPDGMRYAFLHATTNPHRVPPGYTLLQVGYRGDPAAEHAIVTRIAADLGITGAPVVQRIDLWPEADPLSPQDTGHAANIAATRQQLPAGIALVGDDYSPSPPAPDGIHRLAGRVKRARAAARKIVGLCRADSNSQKWKK